MPPRMTHNELSSLRDDILIPIRDFFTENSIQTSEVKGDPVDPGPQYFEWDGPGLIKTFVKRPRSTNRQKVERVYFHGQVERIKRVESPKILKPRARLSHKGDIQELKLERIQPSPTLHDSPQGKFKINESIV